MRKIIAWMHLHFHSAILKLTAKGEHAFHLSYLALVGWEGEHFYKYAAIGLLVCLLVNATGVDHVE